jgi:hypothetical protein
MLAAGHKTFLKAELSLCPTNTTMPQKGTERTEHKHHCQNPQILCFHKNETVLVGRCPNSTTFLYAYTRFK